MDLSQDRLGGGGGGGDDDDDDDDDEKWQEREEIHAEWDLRSHDDYEDATVCRVM